MISFNLYAVTNRRACAPTPLIDVVSELLDAGVTAIQLREKDLSRPVLVKLARQIAVLCETYRAKLFINSDTLLAIESGAAGVHLPEKAESVQTLKTPIHRDFYVGCSVHSLAAAQRRADEGADFVTYSPIYPTASKPAYHPRGGIGRLTEVTTGTKLPVFALGGITPNRVTECLAAGAFGVAVMSGVMLPIGAGKQAARYLNALDRQQ